MSLSNILNNLSKKVKSNSPEILTAIGVSGVITTSYLTAKASFKAAEIIREKELDGHATDLKLLLKYRTQMVWKFYIPASISGVVTIGCIIGASKANGTRTAAAVTAYSITEKAFGEYKEKVVEQIGKGKEQKIKDELAQERVDKKPPTGKDLIVVGPGYVLCCELFTNRYFRGNMDTLKKAQNDINARIISDFYVTLDEFYDLVNLAYTSNSSNIGWDSDKLLELQFSTVLSDGGEPCLAFDYNYVRPLK